MAEKKDIKNAKKIDDNDLNKVSGGAFWTKYSNEEYEEAGVTLVFPTPLVIWGYKFRGMEINEKQADAIVKFYKENGRQPENITEVYRLYRDEIDSLQNIVCKNPVYRTDNVVNGSVTYKELNI